MPTFARPVAGIIELTPVADDAAMPVDDSCLQQLLASFARHDDLSADADTLPSCAAESSSRWSDVGSGSLYDSRTTITADLSLLVEELEREYARMLGSL